MFAVLLFATRLVGKMQQSTELIEKLFWEFEAQGRKPAGKLIETEITNLVDTGVGLVLCVLKWKYL